MKAEQKKFDKEMDEAMKIIASWERMRNEDGNAECNNRPHKSRRRIRGIGIVIPIINLETPYFWIITKEKSCLRCNRILYILTDKLHISYPS